MVDLRAQPRKAQIGVGARPRKFDLSRSNVAGDWSRQSTDSAPGEASEGAGRGVQHLSRVHRTDHNQGKGLRDVVSPIETHELVSGQRPNEVGFSNDGA